MTLYITFKQTFKKKDIKHLLLQLYQGWEKRSRYEVREAMKIKFFCRIFQGEKIPQHAFLRKGSKAVGPMSQIYGM
jgi:DNA gyrase inhibitor GyrI